MDTQHFLKKYFVSTNFGLDTVVELSPLWCYWPSSSTCSLAVQRPLTHSFSRHSPKQPVRGCYWDGLTIWLQGKQSHGSSLTSNHSTGTWWNSPYCSPQLPPRSVQGLTAFLSFCLAPSSSVNSFLHFLFLCGLLSLSLEVLVSPLQSERKEKFRDLFSSQWEQYFFTFLSYLDINYFKKLKWK